MHTWIAVAAIGLGIGFLGGAFGKGGSAIASPLLLLAGLPPIVAVASPLPSAIPSTLGAADRYRRVGLLDRRVILASVAAGVPATILGAIATRWIDPAILVRATEVLIIGIGLRLALATRHAESAPLVPPAAPSTAVLLAVGAGVGLISGLLANGGGFLLAPLYLSVLRLPIKPALGASLVVSAALAIPGTIVHASLGHIDWAVAGVLAASAIPASRAGAALALRTPSARLERAFGVLLILIGAATLVL